MSLKLKLINFHSWKVFETASILKSPRISRDALVLLFQRENKMQENARSSESLFSEMNCIAPSIKRVYSLCVITFDTFIGSVNSTATLQQPAFLSLGLECVAQN